MQHIYDSSPMHRRCFLSLNLALGKPVSLLGSRLTVLTLLTAENAQEITYEEHSFEPPS
jgi:hypothetical protein